MKNLFQDAVVTKYNIFNSLFLSLPYAGIAQTSSLLPLLTKDCQEGFEKGLSPKQIIENFFEDQLEDATEQEKVDLLFAFIQYIERQVVLFDSVEDAAFKDTHDLNGKGSIGYLVTRLGSEEMRKKLREKLEDYNVRVVLTAHPTQFYGGKVLGIINDLEEAIQQNDFGGVNRLLLQLGKTGFINSTQPTPYDEAVSLCWFLENIYYRAIPGILVKLANQLEVPLLEWPLDKVFRLGFWPGGDRDGNPFVTGEITHKVADRLREGLLRAYYRDIRELKRRLTFKGVEDKIATLERKMNSTIFGPEEEGYQNVEEVLAELYAAREVIITKHDGLFLDILDEFILKLRLFGFFFASLDIRQDSRKHTKAWADIIARLEQKIPLIKLQEYESWEEDRKIDLLLSLDISSFTAEGFEDPITQDIIDSIRAIKTIQARNGEAGAHRYVISNSTSALNIIEVAALAKNLIADKDGKMDVDIVPLFETVDDLADASAIMKKLYTNPFYRKHLAHRGDKQTVMVGFSDGTKDGGYLQANWSIYKAKEELTRISREYDIDITFFDGRGGPPARGGGNNQNFYASLGKEIEAKEIQLTIQGQTISSNYGTVTTASYNLERLFTAGLENFLFREDRQEELSAEDKELLNQLAEAAYEAYLELKNHPSFVKYLEKKTPLRFYGKTNIGSRPTKRGSGSEGLKFEDLRAIPFVGSWAQMKQNVPGYYGFGSAIQKLKDQGKLSAIQQLYNKSLFVRTLVENSMQSLSKAYFPVTNYIREEEEYREFWDKMLAEYHLTKEKLIEISGVHELLDQNVVTKESIKVRERIVLPLITIQQYALQMLAKPEELKVDAAKYDKLIMRAMFGIINAARNSA